jgi:hypothetical protein
MGGERWLMLKSPKEADRLREYLAPLDGSLEVPEGNGVWFDWHGKCRIEVGYQANVLCSEVADLTCREITKRFGVTKLGSSSTGWYAESDWQRDPTEHPRCATARYGPHKSWVEWMGAYKQAWSHYFGKYPDDYDDEQWAALETPVVDAFLKLDAS